MGVIYAFGVGESRQVRLIVRKDATERICCDGYVVSLFDKMEPFSRSQTRKSTFKWS